MKKVYTSPVVNTEDLLVTDAMTASLDPNLYDKENAYVNGDDIF